MSSQTKTLITTPIFYPNSKLHLGHLYTLILADITKGCFNLMSPGNYYLLTGLDEHGNKVFNAAKQNNMNIMDWLDYNFHQLQELCKLCNINIDIKSRTTNASHTAKVHEIWNILKNKELIYKGEYSGYYSEKDETFFQEHELICKEDKYYTQDGAPVTYITEECWFLKIDKTLIHNLLLNINITPNNKMNEILSMINDSKFGDLCVSRKSGWGINIPNDTSIIYVWLDALVNYISQYDQVHNIDFSNNMIHVLGKDILKFHAVYWVYILYHLGYSAPKFLVHNWFIVGDQKMSKSFNNVTDPLELMQKYNHQSVRFYLIMCDLISSDQMFIEDDIVEKFNTFIVDKYANLIYRVWCILHKNNYKNDIPEGDNILFIDIDKAIQNMHIKEVIHHLLTICNKLNSKFERNQGWLPENMVYSVEIASELKKIMRYFDVILGDNKSLTINFANSPEHVYKRLEINNIK